MTNFKKNTFINCPLDGDYRQMLLAIIFSVKYLGYIPKLSIEQSDSSTTRLSNIVTLIKNCKYGIHDLSRILSTKKDEYARMNMPFELGVDYGCKTFKGGVHNQKKLLILEQKRYQLQKALSDLSGSDIKHHDGEPMTVIKAVRDWFVTEDLKTGPSHKTIWYDFNDFSSDLTDKLIDDKHEAEDLDNFSIPETMTYMDLWFKKSA